MSSIFILDSEANCLISRAYTDNLLPLNLLLRNFQSLITKETPLSSSASSELPVQKLDGVNYIYIKETELYLLCISYYEHTNAMTVLVFLHRFNEILKNYFKTSKLNKDLIIDNFNLIYELFDEVMDHGIPQITDIPILKEVIKLELNEAEENDDESTDQDINSSVLRSSTTNISWRPKGIYYQKNEFFIDVIEKISLIVDTNNHIIKHQIKGILNVKSYLSGMPELKLGLNDSAFFKYLNFHQCVSLPSFANEQKITFTPPDGKFILCEYLIPIKSLPLIQILRREMSLKTKRNIAIFKLRIKTNFKVRTIMHNLRIRIPLDSQLDIDWKTTPKFKCHVGVVRFEFDKREITWILDTVGGDREFEVLCQFKLRNPDEEGKPRVLGMDPPPRRETPDFEEIIKQVETEKEDDVILANSYKPTRNIKIEFEIPDMTLSGLKIDYLKIIESRLNYSCFPWVKYTILNDEYIYRT